MVADSEVAGDGGLAAKITWWDLQDAYPELWSELSGSHHAVATYTSQSDSNCASSGENTNTEIGNNNGASPTYGDEEAVVQCNATSSLPPIRVIDFEAFCRETELPRYPERRELCVTLDSIDRASSFVVFISHCWLRGWSGAEGWDGRPHPDNASHDKFKLCVQGIRLARETWAPGLPRCYVWLDFGCMDQDGNPAGELKQLDEIVRMSDCIFTPVYGLATVSIQISNFYDDYCLPA
jgi:hypothetical protein